VSLSDVAAELQDRLADAVLAVEERSERRSWVTVKPERIRDVVRFLFEDFGGRLATVTGVDGRDDIELLYHFAFDGLGGVLTVRTRTPKPEVALDSVASIVAGANWVEREIHDLLGVNFRGHPDPRRLILADDWPEGFYPLRREARDKLPNRGRR